MECDPRIRMTVATEQAKVAWQADSIYNILHLYLKKKQEKKHVNSY